MVKYVIVVDESVRIFNISITDFMKHDPPCKQCLVQPTCLKTMLPPPYITIHDIYCPYPCYELITFLIEQKKIPGNDQRDKKERKKI